MPPIASEILAIAKDAGCNIFIESGTYQGTSFRRALRSRIFQRCYSVEIVPELHGRLEKAYPEKPNRKVFLGRSHEAFRDQIFPLCSLDDHIFFWLDGHFSGGDTGGAEFPCPLLEELETIREHCPSKSVLIAIDDTDDFGRKNAEVPAWNWPTRAEIEAAARSINQDFFCLDHTGAGHRRKVHRGVLIFSTNPSPIYYGQRCEDEIVWSLFREQEKQGYFVDVGALDGRRFSNTYSFELAGWDGVCVEAHQDYIDVLKKNRPNSICVRAAVAEENKDSCAFYANKRGTLSTLDPSYAGHWRKHYPKSFTGFETQSVPMRTLDTILEEAKAPGAIDLVSIDVEGCELGVLKGFSLDRYKPRVLIIEALDQKAAGQIAKHLRPRGYIRARRIGSNLIYCCNQQDAATIAAARPVGPLVYTRHPLDYENSVTIFATPKPFRGHHGIIQRNAIRSWTLLEPRPKIILFGDDEGTAEVATQLGVRHISGIGCSKDGAPLISAMFERAQQRSPYRLLVYLNADMILTSDFMPALSQAAEKFEEFLMVGQRWDVGIRAPIDFTDGWEDQLSLNLMLHGSMHAVTGIDYFAFTKHLWPHIPPFAVGRVGWDNWMIYDCLASQRPVIDASSVVTAAHQNHDFSHLAGGWEERTRGVEAQRNLALARECLATGKVIGFTSHASWKFTASGRIVRRT